MKIKGALFDMDGVIFDTEMVWQKSFYIANEKFGYNFTESYRQSCCGKREIDIRKDLSSILPENEIIPYRNFMSEYVENEILNVGVPLKNGFLEIIQTLKNHNIKIALTTSNSREIVSQLFAKVNIDYENIFDDILTSEDVTIGKPNPMIYTKACERLCLSPENCIVFEDAINGIEASFKAGCNTIMVIDIIKPTQQVKEKCYQIFSSLNETNTFLLKTLLPKYQNTSIINKKNDKKHEN